MAGVLCDLRCWPLLKSASFFQTNFASGFFQSGVFLFGCGWERALVLVCLRMGEVVTDQSVFTSKVKLFVGKNRRCPAGRRQFGNLKSG